jgi:hypothetical protein
MTKEETKKRNEQYYLDNKEKIKEKRKQYYLEHKKERLIYQNNWYDANKKSRKEYKEKYYEEKKETLKKQFKRYDLKRKFGITQEEYNQMHDDQNGCCKICGRHRRNFTNALAVDHNHVTGKVRGLLCKNCNQGLGYFKDNVELLIKAIEYLKEND